MKQFFFLPLSRRPLSLRHPCTNAFPPFFSPIKDRKLSPSIVAWSFLEAGCQVGDLLSSRNFLTWSQSIEIFSRRCSLFSTPSFRPIEEISFSPPVLWGFFSFPPPNGRLPVFVVFSQELIPCIPYAFRFILVFPGEEGDSAFNFPSGVSSPFSAGPLTSFVQIFREECGVVGVLPFSGRTSGFFSLS